MSRVWSKEITSFFCSDELNNYDNKVNKINLSKIKKNKESLISILIILGSGLILDKIPHSIVFLTTYIIFVFFTRIRSKCEFKVDYIKPAFIFLITILLSDVMDVEFYKSLILFYTGISIVGINMLEPIYNKKTIEEYILENKSSSTLKIVSVIVFLFIGLLLYFPNLLEYILYISNPIFVIYVKLIISIIKENIILD